MDQELKSVDRVLKALADPTRLRIVALLQAGEVCVCHIHESLKISQPKASRHLAYLRRANVVKGERRGLWVHYQLAGQSSRAAQSILDAVRHCASHVPSARADAKRFEAETGCCVPASVAPGLECCATARPPA
jgi:ArsR family transcriptional regulator, arsenate/arsenite/antimonite-responsive transcriptional repressor